jgi:type IV pilus assembly protein PilA
MTKLEQREGRENKMRKQKGFSLIELLIVVAIILIIAAIAIPNLLRARMAANESSAVQSIRTINTAQVTYQSTYPNVGYSATLPPLGPASAGTTCTAPTQTNACLLDFVLSNATAAATSKSGYYFGMAGGAQVGNVYIDYTTGGIPAVSGQSGVRGFCSNSDGVIRFVTPAAGIVTTNATCAAYTALQ